ncbi:hypothetical protein LCGC14_0774990 [marine sediment metagenome]|uniref:Uncharacterized protein n=1 Tax=marine sediment metagenome TaxID=412755 RepID=A0A0F9SH78_9ZZZZ
MELEILEIYFKKLKEIMKENTIFGLSIYGR